MSAEQTPAGSLREQIDEARRLVHDAETDLDDAVARLRPALIGDKRLSNAAMDRSFEKLRAARDRLSELNKRLAALG
jgi:hypothetical protein